MLMHEQKDAAITSAHGSCSLSREMQSRCSSHRVQVLPFWSLSSPALCFTPLPAFAAASFFCFSCRTRRLVMQCALAQARQASTSFPADIHLDREELDHGASVIATLPGVRGASSGTLWAGFRKPTGTSEEVLLATRSQLAELIFCLCHLHSGKPQLLYYRHSTLQYCHSTTVKCHR